MFETTLVPQPPQFWDNEEAMVLDVSPGWVMDLPVWTAAESPSGIYLRVEVDTDPSLPRVWIRGLDYS